MPLVTRWGSEVRTVSPLEPGPEDPKPKALDYVSLPVVLTSEASTRLPFFNNPKPLKRNFQHPLPPELPDSPASGLDVDSISQAQSAPDSSLDIDSVSVNSPTSGLDIDSASVNSPAAGIDIDSANKLTLNPPAAGIDIDSASVNSPAAGIDIDSTSVNSPAAGIDIDSASVNSPASGIDIDSASVNSPASGLDVDSGIKLTLNIELASNQSFADDPNTGETGEIKYSSDTGYLYIHDGTSWHRINGA